MIVYLEPPGRDLGEVFRTAMHLEDAAARTTVEMMVMPQGSALVTRRVARKRNGDDFTRLDERFDRPIDRRDPDSR